MNPTEKSLALFQEDNEKLRKALEQLRSRLPVLSGEITQLKSELKQSQKQCAQLTKLYNEEKLKYKKTPTPTVHLSAVRVQLYSEIENFIRNYQSTRPQAQTLSTTLLTPTYSAPHVGTWIPATLLYDTFLSISEWEIPPTLNLFCRQLNAMGLRSARVRQLGTSIPSAGKKIPRPCSPDSWIKPAPRPLPPSKQLAKINVYLIPYSPQELNHDPR